MKIRSLLMACLILRFLLVCLGGQHFFPDEARYDWVLDILHTGPSVIFAHPGHPGFYILMLPVAFLHAGVALMLGRPQETLNWIPGFFTALWSASVIALIYGIALRSTGERRISNLAAIFATSSASLLYFCRHLVPYDSALALALFSIYLNLDYKQAWYKSFAAGVIASFSGLVYSGSSLLVLVALGLSTVQLRRSPQRLLIGGVGVLVPVVALRLLGGAGYWSALKAFSGTVTQGWFTDGPAVPWLYLWDTEHFLFVILLIGLLLSFRTETKLYAWAAIALYMAMFFASAGLHKFVVYGRTARTLTPFLCIAAAGGWYRILRYGDRLSNSSSTWMQRIALVLLALQVSFNWEPILTQKFPADVANEIARLVTYSVASSVGSCNSPSPVPKTELVLLNPFYLWPVECYAPIPHGRILYETRHPFQYRPYSYESFGPHQRNVLQRSDISIRLVQQ